MLKIIQMFHIFYAITLMTAERICLSRAARAARCWSDAAHGQGGKKISTADLADSATAVFHPLSAALTQGNMSRLGRCELNPAA